jgi:DNA-nicking Smr family endonuclease
MKADESGTPGDEPLQLPIESELDLHTFHPRDLKELLPTYLMACREKGILEVRVVHGKGAGQLRRGVHALLARMPEVSSYSLATEPFGGHGATIVHLQPIGRPKPGSTT